MGSLSIWHWIVILFILVPGIMIARKLIRSDRPPPSGPFGMLV